MKAKISHILYDLGNTLLYLDAPWPQVFADGMDGFRSAAERAGLSVEPHTLANRFRTNMELYYSQRELDFIERTTARVLSETFEQLGVPANAALVEALLTGFYSRTQEHWKANPEARSVLQEFQQRGYRQAILSNAAHDADVQGLVDKCGIRTSLDFVLSSAAIGYRKPHTAAFSAALSRWDVQPEHVLMVGDTLNADILGAANSGIRSVWTTQHLFDLPKNAPRSVQPDFEINRLGKLMEMLS